MGCHAALRPGYARANVDGMHSLAVSYEDRDNSEPGSPGTPAQRQQHLERRLLHAADLMPVHRVFVGCPGASLHQRLWQTSCVFIAMWHRLTCPCQVIATWADSTVHAMGRCGYGAVSECIAQVEASIEVY